MSGARFCRGKCGAYRKVLAAAILLIVADFAFAEKTDEVVLYNGNTITGEVKELQQGKVRFKTDHAGTIYLEWAYVHFLFSATFFEVENNDGEFVYGTLGAGTDERELMVIGEEETVVLDMETVVTITPIKETLWQRIDGSLDLGLNYASADNSFQYSLNATATYHQPKYSETVTLNSTETRRDGAEDILRDNLEFDYTRYHKKRFFGTGTLSFTRNSEQGIDLRSELGYAFGRYALITNRTSLSGRAGFSVTREKPSGDEPTTNSVWAGVGVNYHFFLYNFPKTDITVDLTVQPGITDWPRTRANLDASIRREVIKDFTITFSVYDSYDSDPPTAGAANHDYGGVLSMGWTF